MDFFKIIDKLETERRLSREEWLFLISEQKNADAEQLYQRARKVRHKYFGNAVYIRGLIELSSYCKNNCFYCGIRAGNGKAERYRLSEEEILCCCKQGYELGFRTFVMQGGEDPWFSDRRLVPIVAKIRSLYPDCAITLSLGERSKQSYKALFEAGANRYLLRHETADDAHYGQLHPQEMSLAHRKECLNALKETGYQVGCGFMVGSPFQTAECIAQDMLFMQSFQPEMVGIGPFIPHRDTPFKDFSLGSVELTLYLLALTRLLLPNALIPSTTALATADEDGRERGILAGANVIMPNLSPVNQRKKYSLYNNKLYSGSESAQELDRLKGKMNKIGYCIETSRGDFVKNS